MNSRDMATAHLSEDYRTAYPLGWMSDVTRLLDAVENGEPQAAEELLPLVYEELRRLAAARMVTQPPGQTLQATALVHEAYLKLVGGEPHDWNGRKHFFATAAQAMRQILVDRARHKSRHRHGGQLVRVDIDQVDVALPPGLNPETVLSLNEAIEQLRQTDPIKVQVVEMKFFLGLQDQEVAELLQVTTRTIERYWAYAKAWLYERMNEETGP